MSLVIDNIGLERLRSYIQKTACLRYTLNKKLVEVSHMGIKGGSSLVNRLVD